MSLLKRWKESREKRSEGGFNIVEMVVAMALFVAVGGSFVYATIVMEDARVQSGEQTKAVISQGGISNSFRSDISGAKALKLNETATSLNVAKADGSCVRWTIERAPGAESSSVLRASSTTGPADGRGSALSEDLQGGSLSLSSTKASLQLNYNAGSTLSESVKLNLAGADGGACW